MYSYNDYLMHYGRLGMKWGVRNGPPYPLDAKTRRTLKREAKKQDWEHGVIRPRTRREAKREAKREERLIEAGNKIKKYAEHDDKIHEQLKAEREIIEKYGLDKIERKYAELAVLQDMQREAMLTRDTEFKEKFKGLNEPDINPALLNDALDYGWRRLFKGDDLEKDVPESFDPVFADTIFISSPISIKLIDNGFSNLKKIQEEISNVADNGRNIRHDFLMEVLDNASSASKSAKVFVASRLEDPVFGDKVRTNLDDIFLTDRFDPYTDERLTNASPSYVSKTKKLIEAYDAGRK